jgi:hypothetical protein
MRISTQKPERLKNAILALTAIINATVAVGIQKRKSGDLKPGSGKMFLSDLTRIQCDMFKCRQEFSSYLL